MNKMRLFLALLVAVLFSASAYAQAPTFQVRVMNQTFVDSKTLQFDVYLKTLSGTFELAGAQIGLSFADSSRNGGTLGTTAAYVAGTSELSNSAQAPANANIASVQVIKDTITSISSSPIYYTARFFKLAAKAPPGSGSGSIISSSGNGTRLGTFRIVNTADWLTDKPGMFKFRFTSATPNYPTVISAYVGGSNTNITVANGTYTIDTWTGATPLPVELTSFSAAVKGRNVNLKWATSNEVNSSAFMVERSLVKDGARVWESVASVKAAGNSNSPKEYTYTDKKLNVGKYAYRLKMVDADGSSEYSREVEGEVAQPREFDLSQNYPNPFNPSTRIDYQIPVDARVRVELFSIAGERVAVIVDEQQSTGYYTYDVNASTLGKAMTSGIYLYRIIAESGNGQKFVSTKKMMLIK